MNKKEMAMQKPFQRHSRKIVIAASVAIVTMTATASVLVYINFQNPLQITIHRASATHVATNAMPSSKAANLLPDGQDWTQYRFDVTGTGMNPEGQISVENVAQLSQQWAVH